MFYKVIDIVFNKVLIPITKSSPWIVLVLLKIDTKIIQGDNLVIGIKTPLDIMFITL